MKSGSGLIFCNPLIRSDEEKRTGTMDDSDDMQDLADFDASEFDVDAGA